MIDLRRTLPLGAAAVLVAGAVLRMLPLIGTDFPLNDGGLFQVMATDLRQAEFRLPPTTSYNDAETPWIYPPLGLYLVGALEAAGMSSIHVLRILPLALSIASIPVVFLIAKRLLGNGDWAVVAAATFAFSTGSYRWLVMGGGVTRALGLLCAVLAVYFAIRLYGENRRWLAIVCGAMLGLTALAHPQAAVFAAVSVPLLLPFTAAEPRRAVGGLAIAVAAGALVVAPWLAAVLSTHGPGPLLSGAGTGGPLLLGVIALFTGRNSGGYLEIIGVVTILGMAVCAMRRFWLPVAWILVIAFLDSRAGQPYLAVPASVAVAFFFKDIRDMAGRWIAPPDRGRRYAAALTLVFITAAFADSVASQGVPGSPLRQLPRETRNAMAWVSSETEPDATFLVVSGWHWALDAESEWFPVLAGRTSLGTVQGTEWTGEFEARVKRATELPRCIVIDDERCLERWFAQVGEVDYLFLVDTPSQELAPELDGEFACCQQLDEQLSSLYDTEVVHRGGAVEIVRLRPLSQARP